MSEYNPYVLAGICSRLVEYWLNIGSTLYEYGCATRRGWYILNGSLNIISYGKVWFKMDLR